MLVYAHRRGNEENERIADWLEDVANGQRAYGLTDLVLSGFLRIATHPSLFDDPSSVSIALDFVDRLRDRPSRVDVRPGPRHWTIFRSLCATTKARGNHVPDAFLAALAIESGSEWITTDRGFARYPGLDWRHPLEPR